VDVPRLILTFIHRRTFELFKGFFSSIINKTAMSNISMCEVKCSFLGDKCQGVLLVGCMILLLFFYFRCSVRHLVIFYPDFNFSN
jgi:hypothetical protein